MKNKAVSGVLLTLLLTSMVTLAFNIQPAIAEPTTWTVDDDGPADFSTIQEAVNAASLGDTIYVKAGTYREPQVTIHKPLQLVGENKNTTIVDGGGTSVCLYVQNTQNVNISGFTLQNGFGLYSWGSQKVTINENIIFDNEQGIVIGESAYITVSRNIVVRNGVMPIHLDGSSNIKIFENIVTLNDEDSIWLGYSSNNSIYWNEITSNGRGIRLDWSSNNRIFGNDITNNGVAIFYWASSNNTLRDNKIEDNVSGIGLNGYPGNLSSFNTICENNIENNDNGVYLEMSLNNSIYRNNITNNNQDGIRLVYSSNNSIYENNITSNGRYDRYGILLSESSNNIIYHNNFVNNTHQVETYNSVNLWDNGYPSGGNLWSNYPGVDRNGDGIGDTPYVIDENNIDNYPLMGPLILGNEAVPLWMQWLFWTIVVAGIIALAGAVYFLKKRSSPPPTVPSPPPETAVE